MRDENENRKWRRQKLKHIFLFSWSSCDDSFSQLTSQKQVENNFLVQLTCQKNKLIMLFLCFCKQMAKKRKIFGENIWIGFNAFWLLGNVT